MRGGLLRRGQQPDSEDLAALQGAWSTAYAIGVDDGTWHASCKHGVPLLLTARTPGELAARIQVDWVARGWQ